MDGSFQRAILDAVRRHPAITRAAVTGSAARGAAFDELSDLDLLLVALDEPAVREVRSWLPEPDRILLCDFHHSRVCSVLWEGFEKMDAVIHSVDDPPSEWVVLYYCVVKGDSAFEQDLGRAAADTERRGATNVEPDASLTNALLLLVMALQRSRRGEKLSAHAFLSAACGMTAALERRRDGMEAGADPLDPVRRLEAGRPALARALHRALFDQPDRGIASLARYLAESFEASMTREQLRVTGSLLAIRAGPPGAP